MIERANLRIWADTIKGGILPFAPRDLVAFYPLVVSRQFDPVGATGSICAVASIQL